jgi:hypothetical protein
MDLRTTIRAVVRLPFEPDHLTQIICQAESSAALNPEDEDHTTFWLVLADQFARRGIASSRVRETAVRIIDSGQDLEMQRRLGQSIGGLEKRRRILSDLRDRLTGGPAPAKTRATLRSPQPFLMEVGDALIYPTCGGACWNPYTTRQNQLKIYGPRGGQPWSRDGWGAMVIVEHGRAFAFFAWYRPVVIRTGMRERPDLEALRRGEWHLELPGTCSPAHFRRMQIEKVGTLSVDVSKVHQLFPGLRSGDSQAASDISIANRMKIWPERIGRPANAARTHVRDIRIDELGS